MSHRSDRWWRSSKNNYATSIPVCFSSFLFSLSVLRVLCGECASSLGWRAVFGEADAGDLPACSRREEIAIRGPAVAAGRQTGTATQYILVHHELAVVFADRALGPEVTGVGRVARLRPLPCLAE